MNDYRILTGDVLDQLATLPDRSVHCCVTSPPYWGLRDYGTATWLGGDPACDHRPGSVSRVGKTTLGGGTATAGHQHEGYRDICGKCGALRQDNQIGLEPTPAAYVARLVEVFAAVWRVLRDDGTLWLNLGDSYANDGKWGGTTGGKHVSALHGEPVGRMKRETGLKPKDLVGIPWRVAFALQDAGWYLRSDIIWAKPNPMPESVTDRPTKSHEYLFLLTKRARYFYDAEAIKETSTFNSVDWNDDGTPKRNSHKRGDFDGKGAPIAGREPFRAIAATRNRRSVWSITTEPYPEAHFATFPTKLVEPCILAGTSERGCCPVCGAPWVRVIERAVKPPPDRINNNGFKHDAMTTHGEGAATLRNIVVTQTTAWRPTCMCGPRDPIPCIVLDPFVGSGTTIAVAVGLGRHGIGIELNPAYVALAHERVGKVQRPLPLAIYSKETDDE